MKISNSKTQLAKIISENGGWRDGARFAAQDSKKDSYPSRIGFYLNRPEVDGTMWVDGDNGMVGCAEGCINGAAAVPNWHQTILSRDEYFHLYPASDADGWIEWKGGECPVAEGTPISIRHRDGEEFPAAFALGDWNVRWTHDGKNGDVVAYRLRAQDAAAEEPEHVWTNPPTIEQLAAEYRNRKDYAERKQQEADSARVEADAKLEELVAAGKAVGLVVGVAGSEPELPFRIGDTVRLIRRRSGAAKLGDVGAVVRVDSATDLVINFPSQSNYLVDDTDVELVSRGAQNA